jgi:ComEC/Rec2-related protein
MVFIPGMIVAILTGIPMVAWLAAFFVAIGIGAGFLMYRIRHFRATIVLALGFFLGGALVASQQILNSTQVLNSTCSGPYTGIIKEITPNTNGHRATVVLLPSHKLLVYFSHCGGDISIGDTISFSKAVDIIPLPKSDFEFNAARYYSSLGIHHRVFLRSGEYDHASFYGFSLSRSSNRLRNAVSNKIKDRLPHHSSSAIVIAMLIGDKSNIDATLRTSYSKAGSIHILAISGLHIGIVASILIAVLGLPMPQRSRTLAIIKASTVLAGIWSFTWISGMSPSATRAAFMFTIYLTGLLMMRKAQILNILGFTAIFLLVREPFLLQNLGFQFSFLALSGIVIWGMPLLRSFSFKHRIIQYGWSIIAISLGAQILVAPAILYYFNEISIVSPITSLVAIPAAYIIVLGGILMLFAELIAPIAGSIVGGILSQGINMINQLFTAFSELPMSTLNNVYIDTSEVTILACVILLISFRILTNRKICLILTVPFSILFALIHCQSYLERTDKPRCTIYASKSEFALDFISATGTQTTLNPELAGYYTMQAARRNRLQHYSSTINLINQRSRYSGSSLFSIKISNVHSKPIYMLYIGSDPGQLSLSTDKFSYVILSKGLDYRIARRLKVKIDQSNLVVHDMRRQGAFNLSLL